MTYRANPDPDFPDVGTFAYTMTEHVADNIGDEHSTDYLVEVVHELFTLDPAVRERVLGAAISDIREELHQQGDPDAARAVEEAERRMAERS